MKKLFYFLAILGTVFMTSCSKSNEADLTAKWLGVYNNPSSGLTRDNNMTVSLNNIIVTKVSGSSMKVQIKALETNYIYTYATLKNVTLNGANKATIDEVGTLAETTGQYHIKGTMTLSGNQVTITATATNMAASQESDVKNINFAGIYNK